MKKPSVFIMSSALITGLLALAYCFVKFNLNSELLMAETDIFM